MKNKSYTRKEKAYIRNAFRQGISDKEIGATLGRTRLAIARYRSTLGAVNYTKDGSRGSRIATAPKNLPPKSPKVNELDQLQDLLKKFGFKLTITEA